MSAGAVGLENGRFIRSCRSKDSPCECINGEIHQILRDIGRLRQGKKRSASIHEDAEHSLDDLYLRKKKRTDAHPWKQEDEKEGESSQDELSHTCLGLDVEGSACKCCNRSKRPRSTGEELGGPRADGGRSKSDSGRSKINQTEMISKSVEECVNKIIEHIKNCNDIEEARRVMIPLLNEFLKSKFIFKEDGAGHVLERKEQVEATTKENKILRSAVRWQYQMIQQLQKLVESQKDELETKNNELNQIKAKVHQYIYECSNPPKNTWPKIYPDVY